MKFILAIFVIILLITPASALDITAPTVPEEAADFMPQDGIDFPQGLWELAQQALTAIVPHLKEAGLICGKILVIILLISILDHFSETVVRVSRLAGSAAIAFLLLGSTDTLIQLGSETVEELSQYGKLLLPVMTGALAAQGGLTSSGAMYMGTAIFDTALSSAIANLLVPGIYLFLVMSIANAALKEDILGRFQSTVKWLITWCLKIILYVFTGYMGITNVISGTTDAAALKAAKLTISGAVPVVGSILSDASESVLVSAALVKNAAGAYGILAILALCMGPFLKIGAHYLMLKLTYAVSGTIGSKELTGLIGGFSTAMGLLLAMTGSVCLFLLISTVCFMKGIL